MANKIRFGLTLSNRGVLLGLTQPEELLEMAELAESSGAFEHVWVGDSIMAKPRMESITLMSAIAARTRRVKIGVACMASFPSRDPIVPAYQWASLDLLSNGRMIMGACMGGTWTSRITASSTATWASRARTGPCEWRRTSPCCASCGRRAG